MARRLLVRVQVVAPHKQMLVEAVVLRTSEAVGEVAPRRQTLEVEEVLHRRTEAEEVLPQILAEAVEAVRMSPRCAPRRRRLFSLL